MNTSVIITYTDKIKDLALAKRAVITPNKSKLNWRYRTMMTVNSW